MKFAYIALLLILVSCQCKKPDIDVIRVDDPNDLKLSCRGLDYEIGRLEIELQSLKRKEAELEAYAGPPLCLPSAVAQVMRAKEAVRSRQEKLAYIKSFKECNDPAMAKTTTAANLKIEGNPIDSADDGLEKVKLQN